MTKNNSFKGFLAVLIAFIISVPVFAQYSASELKSIEKAKALYAKGKYDKSIATLKKVQVNHFYDNDLWEMRCGYEYDRYNDQLIKDFLNIVQKASKGKGNFNFDELQSTKYRQEMLGACSIATLICGKQEMASMILHEQFFEPSGIDSAVSDEAHEEYGKGYEDYSNSDYSAAIRHFEKALRLDSNYYYANYRLAMCYFKDEKFEKAIPYFQQAIRIQPEMLDPRQNLVTSYMKVFKWQDAYKACVDGIISYPDIRFFTKLDEIADKLGKTFNRHWMKRDCVPNMISSEQAVPNDAPWSYYVMAKDKISNSCNDDGILKKKSDLTEQKYMEVYSWEYMLKKSDSDQDELGFARKVEADGYLDCFAMVSMYHVTFSEQYTDFSKKNADRIRKYIDTYLMK